MLRIMSSWNTELQRNHYCKGCNVSIALLSVSRESAVQLQEHREKADLEHILFQTANELPPPSLKAQRLPLNRLREREHYTCGWCCYTACMKIPSRKGSKPPSQLCSPSLHNLLFQGFGIKWSPCQHCVPQPPVQVQQNHQTKRFTETQARVRK